MKCSPSRTSRTQLPGLDRKARGAERAVDGECQPIVDRPSPARSSCGKRVDDRPNVGGVAATAAAELDRRERPDFVLLVEQPPDQVVERQSGSASSSALHRPAEDRDVGPVGMVKPRMQSLAPLLAFGEDVGAGALRRTNARRASRRRVGPGSMICSDSASRSAPHRRDFCLRAGRCPDSARRKPVGRR